MSQTTRSPRETPWNDSTVAGRREVTHTAVAVTLSGRVQSYRADSTGPFTGGAATSHSQLLLQYETWEAINRPEDPVVHRSHIHPWGGCGRVFVCMYRVCVNTCGGECTVCVCICVTRCVSVCILYHIHGCACVRMFSPASWNSDHPNIHLQRDREEKEASGPSVCHVHL